MSVRCLILALSVALAQPTHAVSPDLRIQLLAYESDQVVTLTVTLGYAAVVELAPDEMIQNVVVGNSAVWQVTATSSSDRIIVKPLADAITTNMIVVTDKRRYIFLLEPFVGDGQGLFVLRFTYPDTPSPTTASLAPAATYKLSGAKGLFPAEMRDDGKRTTITWADQSALPAVFAMGEGGEEAIVNGRMKDGRYVIEGTFAKFVFRRGDARAFASRQTARATK